MKENNSILYAPVTRDKVAIRDLARVGELRQRSFSRYLFQAKRTSLYKSYVILRGETLLFLARSIIHPVFEDNEVRCRLSRACRRCGGCLCAAYVLLTKISSFAVCVDHSLVPCCSFSHMAISLDGTEASKASKPQFDLKKAAVGAFAAMTIASNVLTAPADAVDTFPAFSSTTTFVSEKVIREGVYKEYEVDVLPQTRDDARSTFKAAKETKTKKGKAACNLS